MRTPLIVFSTLFMLLLSAGRANAWATLAIDTNQGHVYGWAINYDSQSSADMVALSQCGRTCSIVMTFAHTCAAYAADQGANGLAYGWAYDQNPPRAQERAFNICHSQGGVNCILLISGCDR
jgi:hypothetical protein